MNTSSVRPPTRDPAWLGRVFWSLAALVLLWPLLVATEFKPWVLLAPESLQVSGHFIGSFWPLAHGAEFLAMVARETWRTVAMATAGMTLALIIALPLTLMSTRVLSISALAGPMARGPFWLRQSVRWLLVVLRSIPELVWALVFVRVVGLGPTAGVLAIALALGTAMVAAAFGVHVLGGGTFEMRTVGALALRFVAGLKGQRRRGVVRVDDELAELGRDGFHLHVQDQFALADEHDVGEHELDLVHLVGGDEQGALLIEGSAGRLAAEHPTLPALSAEVVSDPDGVLARVLSGVAVAPSVAAALDALADLPVGGLIVTRGGAVIRAGGVVTRETEPEDALLDAEISQLGRELERRTAAAATLRSEALRADVERHQCIAVGSNDPGPARHIGLMHLAHRLWRLHQGQGRPLRLAKRRAPPCQLTPHAAIQYPQILCIHLCLSACPRHDGCLLCEKTLSHQNI